MIANVRLKFPVRDEGYTSGNKAVEAILRGALEVIINEGYRALTMRKISSQSGVGLGSITHYFDSKEQLIRTLLDAIINGYLEAFKAIRADPSRPAEEQLSDYITLVLKDNQTRRTTNLFPELWALSNFDPFIAEQVDAVYAAAREPLIEVIRLMNPDLSPKNRERVALYISGSLEGLLVFAGFGKPWSNDLEPLISIAVTSSTDYVLKASNGDISES